MDRQKLKTKGLALMKANYWYCVVAALVMGILSKAANANSRRNSGDADNIAERLINIPTEILAMAFGTVCVVLLISIALTIFVINPLKLGCVRFFTMNHYEKASLSELGFGFTANYKNVVKIMFFRDLYTVLWTFLFVIPGIVKSIEYSMIPYLLAENPDMTKEEAFATTKSMMNGNKMNEFVLGLSFIGWFILSAFTAGIAGILLVDPYYQCTLAEFYFELKGGDTSSWLDKKDQVNVMSANADNFM